MKNKLNLKLFSLCFSALLLCSSLAWTKELYMTVRRDYGPSEAAAIELIYYSTGPIQLRVLAPKDLKGFIASQLDLRRSWREPKLHFNPMYFLAEGMNEMSFDTDWIRTGVDWRMRKGAPELGGADRSDQFARINPGPEKIISSPEGFTLVSEQIITPEGEDASNAFDVPGFDSWFGSRGSMKTKIVSLPKLAPGFYVVQTIQGNHEGQVIVVVNDIMAQLHQSSGTGVYHVARRDGSPFAGATVSIRNLQGKWIANGKTDANGQFKSGVTETDLLTLIEAPGGGTAIIDSEFFSTTAVFPDLYLYTDRPMYRIGDEVQFRGILRESKSGKSAMSDVKAGTSVDVQLVSLDGQNIGSAKNVKVTEFGTFSGTFPKAAAEAEGVYRVVASVQSKKHVGEIRIKDYVKPLFFVTVKSEKETARAGDKIRADIKAELYAGGHPVGAKARAQVYRVRMESPQWVEDAGLGETGSAVTYGGDTPSPSTALPILIAENDSIELDEKANGFVEFDLPKELPGAPGFDYKFQLKVTVMDADENMASGSVNFLDLNSDVTTQARFNKVLAEDVKSVRLTVRSLTPSGNPFPSAKGTVEFVVTAYGQTPRSLGKQAIQTDATGKLVIPLPTNAGSGEIKALVSLMDSKNRPASADSSVIVATGAPASGLVKVDELTLVTEATTAKVGQTVRILALLPEAWGVKGTKNGKLNITVAGRQLFENRTMAVNGLGTWIEQKIEAKFGSAVTLLVSYADPNGGWTERRASFRIMDPSRALRVTVTPLMGEVPPGGKQTVKIQVLDQTGKPVRAEVSLAVVDRSVLDLQPEIRPSLLDFFYPMDRLNLMVFLSSQFQSYGYGERVAKLFKPNYWFAATKSQAEALEQKDTAYWTGSLVTDAKGVATTSFNVPGNQTIWRAIAVAADTDGRFGESQKEFKSQMPISTILALPAFLRRGDEANVRVSLAAQKLSQPLAVEYQVTAPSAVQVTGALQHKGEMKGSEQVSKTARLKVLDTAEAKPVEFVSRVKIADGNVGFKNSMKIIEDLSDQTESFLPEKSKILVKPEAGAFVRSATLQVRAGFYGTLLPSMKWLIRYPHGCVEQTTSATIPNLVFATLLGDPKYKLSKEETELRDQALAFGERGIKSLKGYLKPEGSVGWFAADFTGDVNMSLLILGIMASVDSSKFNIIEFSKTYEFIRRAGIVPASSQGILLNFVNGAMIKAYHYSAKRSAAQVLPELKLQTEWALSPQGSPRDQAYLLLAMKNLGVSDKEVEELRAKLVASLKKSFAAYTSSKVVDYLASSEASWQAYPGREGSTLAIIGNALHTMAKPAELPAKFIETLRQSLVKYFDGEAYGSTFETSMVMLHSQWLIRQEFESTKEAVAGKAVVKINGKPLALTDANTKRQFGGFDVLLPAGELGKKPGASLEVDIGELAKSMSVRLLAKVGTPYAQAKPVNAGWQITRKYFKLGAAGAKAPIDLSKEKIKVGDLLFVQLEFSRNAKAASGWASRYYILSDDVPAGFQVIDEDKMYEVAPYLLPIRGSGFRVREVGAERMRWYYDFTRGWMEKSAPVGYVMRANFSGTFQSGVASIQDFYSEDIFGRTDAVRIQVDGPK
ncbi:MAG: MG2 domain-containing protein [Bdellovibrionales bacterium]|nr:MG2 domain-containing protein [Bdellovibrionales bacterium]